MVIQLLVNLDIPNARIFGGSDLQESFKLLAIDCLKRGMNKSKLFKITPQVIALPSGFNVTVAPEMLFGLIANNPLLTKSDLTRHFNTTPRTIERWVNEGKIPQPIYIQSNGRTGPRWRPEDIAACECPSNGNGHH